VRRHRRSRGRGDVAKSSSLAGPASPGFASHSGISPLPSPAVSCGRTTCASRAGWPRRPDHKVKGMSCGPSRSRRSAGGIRNSDGCGSSSRAKRDRCMTLRAEAVARDPNYRKRSPRPFVASQSSGGTVELVPIGALPNDGRLSLTKRWLGAVFASLTSPHKIGNR